MTFIEISEDEREHAIACLLDLGLTEDEAEREVDEYYGY